MNSLFSNDFEAAAGERLFQASLDGRWQIRFPDGDAWSRITVPGPWQADFPERAWDAGSASYRRSFERPPHKTDTEVVLRFGAVNYFCSVRLNGRELGSHEGGYLPFEFVLEDEWLRDVNELDVDVRLPSVDPVLDRAFPFAEIPHGKQSWYGLLGGIWQSVTLALRPRRHISHCAIRAAMDGTAQFVLECSTRPDDVALARITILSPDGSIATTGGGPAGQTIHTRIDNPQRWSPEHPWLYTSVVELWVGNMLVHSVSERFGYRSIETRDGQFLLNGAPLYLRGALDQDYYPDGICTPPSLAFLEDQARKAKALGLNLLRVHIKVPDPRYYDVADRLGLLVWSEIPSCATFTETSAQRLIDTMSGILKRDGNHPSIIIWTIINKDQGTRLDENPDQRDWLKNAYQWLKHEDPSRLAVDNSPCGPNYHVQSDIDDFHYRRAVPELVHEWDALTAAFAERPQHAYSPHGDASRTGDEPLVVSEFGVWGLPDPAKLRKNGKEPFWFESGADFDSSEGVAYPHGIENRFRIYNLGSVFGNFAAFIEATQWHQFNALKYQIEEMRRHASIQGYVITELTDVHWEANGLMDLERNPRVYHELFGDFNDDLVILAKPRTYAIWSGDVLQIDVHLATGGVSVLSGSTLHCIANGTEQARMYVSAMSAGTVKDMGVINLSLPLTETGVVSKIRFELKRDSVVLARNQIAISVYAPRARVGLPSLHTIDPNLAVYLGRLGYPIKHAGEADVHVVKSLSRDDMDSLHRGARYVVLAAGDLPFTSLRHDLAGPPHLLSADPDVFPRCRPAPSSIEPGIGVVERKGTVWHGDWITGFSWIKRSGAFARLPGEPMLDLSFSRVSPQRVLTGFRSWEFGGLVQAGLVSGWVHKPAALIAERTIGRGRVVATTFRLLRDAPGTDPVAATLLDALILSAIKSA
ncbi:glycoside hydrolase family 2 protein [Pararhizobium sp.]|uniref:glycoside hydrolase family 2 protein n=1 Tax=Pararhizobium sp. TaxID=1977563 RepID=UPI0027227D39|nr:glycoside hydrolase family 2 TIM barrel-domain containing protein [Pararhizobium sp.]MDO9418467.1 glycoside hydrolase family 2 TIM barrel-domain containing protein [Pararhizobium sp.]